MECCIASAVTCMIACILTSSASLQLKIKRYAAKISEPSCRQRIIPAAAAADSTMNEPSNAKVTYSLDGGGQGLVTMAIIGSGKGNPQPTFYL